MLTVRVTSIYILLFLLVVYTQLGDGKRMGPKLSAEKQEKYADAINTLSSRVINGTNAELGQVPFQISLQLMNNEHICGGAIIDKDWVLTAAHCVLGLSPIYLLVATGTIQWQEPIARYGVKEFYIHCNYNFPGYHNDIALIHLNESIVWNEYTQPAILPKEPLVNGTEVLLTGWGSTILWGDTPDVLQQATLTYVDYPTCQDIMGGDPSNGYGHICTLTNEGKGACHGDSGGPLSANGIIYGLVNWGYPCAIGYPDSYASVHFNMDWINRVKSEKCSSCHCYASNYHSL